MARQYEASGFQRVAPATPRTSQSDPNPGQPAAALGQPVAAPMETQSDLQGYSSTRLPYVQGLVVGPRAVAREQGRVQNREDEELDEELAELLEEVDEPKPPTEAGCVVQAAEEDQVPLRHRDTILRTAASRLSACAAGLDGEVRRKFLSDCACAPQANRALDHASDLVYVSVQLAIWPGTGMLQTADCLHSLVGRRKEVTSAKFSPDFDTGQRIARQICQIYRASSPCRVPGLPMVTGSTWRPNIFY